MEDQSIVERFLFLLAGLFVREFLGAFGKPDEICNRLGASFSSKRTTMFPCEVSKMA